MSKNVMVIGAGLGGIAVAIRLAIRGFKVTVCESSQGPGGKLSNFSLGPYRFDLGPSLFTLPENVTSLFKLAGKDPADYFSYHPVSHICRYFYPDGTLINAYTEREKFTTELQNKLGYPPERMNRYLDHVQWMYRLNAPVFLERSLHRIRNYFSLSTMKAAAGANRMDIFMTMNQANEKRLGHPKLVQMFNRMATYNGSSPYLAPGILNIISSLEHGSGVFFPEGGMFSITKSLVRLAEELGVTFRFNEKVTGIMIVRNRAAGIRTSTGEYPCDRVVCNSDIVHAYRTLLPGVRAPEHHLKQERSGSALVFYWGIKRLFPALSLHNIFFSKDYRKEFEFQFNKLDIYDDPTIYINISSRECPSDAPEGHENWFVMINAPHAEGQDWEEMTRRVRRNIIERLNRELNTDLEEHIAEERILSPPGIETLTSSWKGSLYGTSSNSKFAAFLRHPNFSRTIKGLYFTGGSVHPGGGIPLVLFSARICSEMIPEDGSSS